MLKRIAASVLGVLFLMWLAGTILIQTGQTRPEPTVATPARSTAAPTATRVPTAAPTRVPTATPEPKPLGVGEQGHLWADGLPQWHLTIDEKARQAWSDAIVAGDQIGIRQLITTGRAFPVADGTLLLVIEVDWFTLKVRVLEGSQFGRVGWVAYEHVVR